VQFVRLAITLLSRSNKVHDTIHLIRITVPNIHWFKKFTGRLEAALSRGDALSKELIGYHPLYNVIGGQSPRVRLSGSSH